jgi:transcriptional regulator with XRE-family HTH domain
MQQDTAEQIGQRIAQLREARGLTQQQLADLAGMRQQHISRMEKGLYDFKVESLTAVLAALKYTLDFIEA